MAAEGISVEAHTTTKAKYLGIEALAVEIEHGRWLLPDGPPTRQLVHELLSYAPTNRPGDRLIAMWLAREAAVASTRREPFPVPFITSSTPMSALMSPGTIVAAPSGFPEDSWAGPTAWRLL